MTTEKNQKSVQEEQVSVAEDVMANQPEESLSVTEDTISTQTEPVAVQPKEKVVKKKPAPKAEKIAKIAKDVEAKEEKPKKVVKKAAKVVEIEESAIAEEKPKKVAKKVAKVVEIEEGAVISEEEKPKKKVVKKVAKTEDVIEELDESSKESVSFEEEEVALAASAPEYELKDDEINTEEESAEKVAHSLEDVATMTKEELVKLFAHLLETKPVQHLRYDIEAIKVAFYKQHRVDVETLKKKFVEDGGVLEEFIAPLDNDEIKLKEYFGEYRKQREEYMANLENTKEDNLKIKQKIIDDLKELVNSNETMNSTFNTFRDLQQRWKEIGVVPQANVKELWETYNLHVENFYNYIKINKELRDLDLKRNYEAKLQLCEIAEALVLEPSVVASFRKLQDLHEEWREIGPVINEYKESVWERFKEASSRVNKQHQDYFETIKEEQKRNLDLKAELCVKAEELSVEMLTSRKEWNKASDKLIEIQKVWQTIGFAPKKDNAKIYERFRNACDKFFELKRSFYQNIKIEMEHNLQLKNEICEAAEAIKDSEQWKKTTDELIVLQKRWKEIGSVSRRHSDVVWKRFRMACDHFFSRKSTHFSGVDSSHGDNLAAKIALLGEIEAFNLEECNFEKIKEYQKLWGEIGFVPFKEKDAIQKRYREAIDRLFTALRSGEKNRTLDKYRSKITSIKSGGGDRRLKFEREKLYNKVKQLEADIATLENNIGFFSKSKNADAMIQDVRNKIEKTRAEMLETIEKVNLIDKQE